MGGRWMRGALVSLCLATANAVAGSPTGAPEDWPMPLKGDKPFGMVLVDRLEYGDSDEANTLLWDAQGWYGTDTHKLWLKLEGEGESGESPESAEFQALYGRILSPFWDVQAGVRLDTRPDPDTAFAVIGLHGLAPQWLEVDTALFMRDEGDVRFRLEAEYELLFTQRLILQPRFELNAAADDVPRYGLGDGVNTTEAGLRLRYEIRREFAPYIGVRWEKKHGDTADIARAADEPSDITSFVVGIRAWY